MSSNKKIGRWIVTVGKKGDKEPEKVSQQTKIPHQSKIQVRQKKNKESKSNNSQSKLF